MRRDGEPCTSWILLEDGYCSVHSPTHGKDMVEFGRRAGDHVGQARREKAKTVRDKLRDWVEANVERIVDAIESGLDSEDERVRIATVEKLLDQAYGRPAVSLIGDPDQPVVFVLDSLLSRAREEQ